ncbi:MAG TPA: MarR family transcriptional regulator [Xanthobacteraceae bacterium]|nr:MarR family transcriptional regulator [Xanthobacteraceae bacterium]
MANEGASGSEAGPAEIREEAVPGVFRLEDQVGFLLRIATQRSAALFAARAVDGLTPPQFATLAKLRETGLCSQNRLGRLVYLDAATIKGVVDRLRARNLVQVTDDPTDRRRRALALTERGRQVTEAAIEVARSVGEATLAPLTADERRQVFALLRKMAELP